MAELIRAQTQRERAGGPPDDFDGVWPNQDPAGFAQVSTGLYTEHLPVVGRTIEDIRQTFADRLDIDPSAQPVLDGQLVTDESTRLEAGQRLAFVRHAGEKGGGLLPNGSTDLRARPRITATFRRPSPPLAALRLLRVCRNTRRRRALPGTTMARRNVALILGRALTPE